MLIVDDEILIADGLREMLSGAMKDRLQVRVCYSAEEAIRVMQSGKIDLLMTDINMPGCTGLELHRQLMSLQPGCPVIYLTGYSEFEYARQALDQHAFAYVLKGEGDDIIIQTVSRAIGEPAQDAQEQKPDAVSAAETGGMPWVPQLKQYIEEHIDKDLSLQHLADYMHFHPVYLSRAFKEATGTTIGDYIGTVRLERAKAMLSGSRLPLQQIAQMTGFASTNYFCRWFHKETRMTPKAFRDQK